MLSVHTYKTINAPSTGLLKDRGSKFIAFAYPVNDETQIKHYLEQLKKEYFDARHICYAYALGALRQQFRFCDDNEPSGTAGKPIYGQIISYGVTNVLVAVVRYFGGTLLGTGGLIQAYKNATADALKNAQIIEKSVEMLLNVTFEYINMNVVMRILKDFNIEMRNFKTDNVCQAELVVPMAVYENVMAQLAKVAFVKE